MPLRAPALLQRPPTPPNWIKQQLRHSSRPLALGQAPPLRQPPCLQPLLMPLRDRAPPKRKRAQRKKRARLYPKLGPRNPGRAPWQVLQCQAARLRWLRTRRRCC